MSADFEIIVRDGGGYQKQPQQVGGSSPPISQFQQFQAPSYSQAAYRDYSSPSQTFQTFRPFSAPSRFDLARQETSMEKDELNKLRELHDNKIIAEEDYERKVLAVRQKYQEYYERSLELKEHNAKSENLGTGVYADSSVIYSREYERTEKGELEELKHKHEMGLGLVDDYEKSVADIKKKYADIAEKEQEKTEKNNFERHLFYIRQVIKSDEQRYEDELNLLKDTFNATDATYNEGGMTHEEFYARKRQIDEKYAIDAEAVDDSGHTHYERLAGHAARFSGAVGAHPIARGIHATQGIIGAASDLGMATGIEGLIAATNPVVIGLAAVAGSSIAAGVALKAFADYTHSLNESNAMYSGAAANASAIAQIREMEADIYRAERIGPRGAEFENIRSETMLEVSKLSTELQADMLEALRAFLPLIRGAADSLAQAREGVKTLNAWGINLTDKALEQLPAGLGQMYKIAKYTGILAKKAEEKDDQAGEDIFLKALLDKFNSNSPDVPRIPGRV